MSEPAAMTSIRVVLAEDHVMVRAGLERLLAAAPDIDVVGLAADGLEAVDQVTRSSPDVVIMDLSMPALDGVSATAQIVAAFPAVRVLVLTSFSDPARVRAAIAAGAVGYLLKDGDPEDLVRAVRSAARGEMPLDPRAARALFGPRADPAAPGGSAPAATPSLTDREEEVLDLVAEGSANKEIARRLGISEKTVKAHLTRIFHRIGVTDRTQAALWVHRHRGRGGL